MEKLTDEEWNELPKWRRDYEIGYQLKGFSEDFMKMNPEFDTKQNCLADNLCMVEQIWADREGLA